MYQFILLDLDNTILDFDTAEKNSITKIIESLDIEYKPEILDQYRKINSSLWKLLEEEKITKDIVLNTRFSELFKLYELNADGEKIENQFRSYLAESSYLIPNAKDTLTELKKRGKSLYAASNGVYSTQIQRLKNAGISEIFDDVFISEKVGYNKPSIHFFDYCLNNIKDLERDKVLMVGDSLSSDIQGAINASIDSCYCNFNNNPDISKATYTIYDISELLNIVK